MKIIEQICVKCGKLLDSGTTWTEANKCPQCTAEVVTYDRNKTYRFYSMHNAKPAELNGLLREYAKKHDAKFIGYCDIGYWLVGPAENVP
jgi:DNA-directed RNA polymerase subunit RPC12/RpoP